MLAGRAKSRPRRRSPPVRDADRLPGRGDGLLDQQDATRMRSTVAAPLHRRGAARIRAGPRAAWPGASAGLAVALVSLWLGVLWVAAIRPLNAPDETAYLQAVMQTRNERSLPEIHFDFSQN